MKCYVRITIVFALILSILCVPILASADGLKPYYFGFKKSRDGKLPSIAQEGFMPELQKHGAIFLGDIDKKVLYLTFDNGYEEGYTAQILNVLKEKKVPAAFFVTGHYVQTQPHLLKRMVNEGHLLGNHTWHHPDMSRISAREIKDELDSVKIEVAKTTDQKDMQFMRPPMGIFNDHMLEVSRQLGYTNVFWSIAYLDWDITQQRGWNYAYQKVMGQLHPGAVMLLHSISRDNMEALAKIIDGARQLGYEFERLDRLKVKHYQ